MRWLRSVPPEGLPAARAAVDLGGVRTRSLRALRLWDAGRDDEHVWLELEASGGRAELLLDDPERVAEVALEAPLAGRVARDGDRVFLSDLAGRGRALLRFGP